MKGTIVDLLPMRPGKQFPVSYTRVSIVSEQGKFYHTDICPSMRNFEHWKDLLTLGFVLDGLELLGESDTKIDADCKPEKIGERNVWDVMNPGQENQMELF